MLSVSKYRGPLRSVQIIHARKQVWGLSSGKKSDIISFSNNESADACFDYMVNFYKKWGLTPPNSRSFTVKRLVPRTDQISLLQAEQDLELKIETLCVNVLTNHCAAHHFGLLICDSFELSVNMDWYKLLWNTLEYIEPPHTTDSLELLDQMYSRPNITSNK